MDVRAVLVPLEPLDLPVSPVPLVSRVLREYLAAPVPAVHLVPRGPLEFLARQVVRARPEQAELTGPPERLDLPDQQDRQDQLGSLVLQARRGRLVQQVRLGHRVEQVVLEPLAPLVLPALEAVQDRLGPPVGPVLLEAPEQRD